MSKYILEATAASSSPTLVRSPSSNGRNEYLTPDIIISLCLIIAAAVMSTLAKNRKQAVLASGYFAGRREKYNAMKTAIEQASSGKIDKLALFVGKEEGVAPDGKTLRQIALTGKSPFLPFAGLNKGLIGLGPPDSGKTHSLQKPLLRDAIRQGKTIICLDPKGDLAREIAPFARSRGYQDYYFNPGGTYTDSFNILEFMESYLDSTIAEQIAISIYENGWGSSGQKDDPFFRANAIAVLRTVLMLAKASQKPDLITAKQILLLPDLVGRLRYAIENELVHEYISESARLFVSGQDAGKMIASIVTTAALTFDGFTRPEFAPALIETTIPKKLEGKQILFLQLPLNKEDVVAPVIAALTEQLIDYNFSQLVFPDGRSTQLLFFADEFHLVKFRKISQWVAVLRSFGFAAILTFQSVAQLEDTYGIQGMKKIYECCMTKVFFAPGSAEAAAQITEMLGEKEVNVINRSWTKGGGSTSESKQKIALWSKEDLLRMPQGECIIFNKSYAANKRSGIPLLELIEIPDSEVELGQRYAAKWQKIRRELEAKKAKYSVKEIVLQIKIRREIGENILPPPSDYPDAELTINSDDDGTLKDGDFGLMRNVNIEEFFDKSA